jgi:hypothetical protein
MARVSEWCQHLGDVHERICDFNFWDSSEEEKTKQHELKGLSAPPRHHYNRPPNPPHSAPNRAAECVFLHGSLVSLSCLLRGQTSSWDDEERELETMAAPDETFLKLGLVAGSSGTFSPAVRSLLAPEPAVSGYVAG